MQLRKLIAFLKGYLLLTVEGTSPEKFINMAVSRGIYLWDLSWLNNDILLIKVEVAAFRALRHIARATRCRVRIRDKRGYPFFVSRFHKRKMLLWGCLIFCLLLHLMSSFIWFVEVKSDRELHYLTPDNILAAAKQEGLYRGAFKGTMDLSKLTNGMGNRVPQLAWVVINIKGTKVTIEVAEQVLPPRSETNDSPANIVATKDGVVKEVLVLSGEARVAENETVRQGDILISGIIQPKLPEPPANKDNVLPPVLPPPKYVRARGMVRARVWYEEEKAVPMVQIHQGLTGACMKSIAIRWCGKEVWATGPKEIPFAYYRREQRQKTILPAGWRNWRILNDPVEVITTTYSEMQYTRQYLGPEKAGQLAEAEASKQLLTKIPPQAKVVERKAEIISRDNQEVLVRVTVEALEEIGQVQIFPAGS
jgi:similar to stage IV sporulation protein